MSKLLSKPLKAFSVYALIILLISVPAYVLVVDYIWVSEMDENNLLNLQQLKQNLTSKELTPSELEQINERWADLLPGVLIQKVSETDLKKDSIYEIVRTYSFEGEKEINRFRGLKSYLELGGKTYQVNIETNVEESDETLMAIALITIFFFVLLILGFLLLNRRISKNSWKEFYQTLEALKAFDLKKENELKLNPSTIQEFNELNLSLQTLVKNNIAIFQMQKSFTENASHELQTPIALLKSKIDLLLQNRNLSPETKQLLSGIEAPLSRLSRINKNLLVLSKVESDTNKELDEIDIQAKVVEALTLFEDYISNKLLRVETIFKSEIKLKTNSFLLETMLQNLLSNAIRHTSDTGQITIQLENDRLYISNTGIAALNQQHLFQRFASATKNHISSGLGLAIIKEITRKNNWDLNYSFENGFHHFSVSF